MSHGIREYDLGDAVRCTAEFRSLSGVLFDPTTVVVKYRHQSGAVVAKTFGTDAEVVKTGVGRYYIDIDANAVGNWYYRWESSGTGQAAAERPFRVKMSNFS